MTAPRWIAEAIDAVSHVERGGDVFRSIPVVDVERLPVELLDRLPVEAMVRAATIPVHGDEATDRRVAREAIRNVVAILADEKEDAVTLAQLYEDASRALDAAGVPYGVEGAALMDMPARIRWLAEQRPRAIDVKRVEAERDAARASLDALRRVAREAPLGWRGAQTIAHRSISTEDVIDWLRRLADEAA